MVAPSSKGRDDDLRGRRRSSLFQALAKVAPVMPPLTVVGGKGASLRSRRSSQGERKSSGYKGSLGSRRFSLAESGGGGGSEGGDDSNSSCRANNNAMGLDSAEGGGNKPRTPSEKLKGRTLTPYD